MVSFTPQNQTGRRDASGIKAQPAEAVTDIMMTEQEFAQMLQVLETHRTRFEKQMGRLLGAAICEPAKRPAGGGDGGMKIRLKA